MSSRNNVSRHEILLFLFVLKQSTRPILSNDPNTSMFSNVDLHFQILLIDANVSNSKKENDLDPSGTTMPMSSPEKG